MTTNADASQPDDASVSTDATAAVGAPTSVYHKILDWSVDKLEPWQQDALRRSVAGEQPSESAIQFLQEHAVEAAMKPLEALLVDAPTPDDPDPTTETADAAATDAEIVALEPLSDEHMPDSSSTAPPVAIHRVRHVTGVNRLKPDAEIELSPVGLNVIYGYNGSGKSGYTRILKQACHSRLPEPIISDVTKGGSETPVAEITYAVDGIKETHLWDLNKPSQDENLPRVAVYDLRSGLTSVQRTGSEVIVNAPGIDGLQTLINYYKDIASALRIRQSLEVASHTPEIIASAVTPKVRSAMDRIGTKGAIDTVLALALLSEAEAGLMASLPKEINQLRADETKALIKALGLGVTQIEREASLLTVAAERIAPAQVAALRKVCEQIKSLKTQQEERTEVAIESPHHLSVHGEHWRTMWDAATQYATQEAYPDLDRYPSPEMERCVLCQQTLSPETKITLDRLATEAAANTEAALRRAESARATLLAAMKESISTEKLSDALIDTLMEENAPTSETPGVDGGTQNEPKVSERLRLARLSLSEIVETPDTETSLLELGNLALVLTKTIQTLAGLKKSKMDKISELQKDSSDPKLLSEKIALLAELKERALLTEHLDALIDAHNSKIRVRALNDAISSCGTGAVSSAITKLSTEYIDDVCKIFEANLLELSDGDIKVVMNRTGTAKGVSRTALSISKVESTEHGLDRILSEGEVRVVALAAFLADAALLGDASAMILDDPVTSLDHNYQRAVAARIVKEARVRQVIVFTHSSTFTADASVALNNDTALQYIEGASEAHEPEYRFIEIARDTNSGLAGIKVEGVGHPINNFRKYFPLLEQLLKEVKSTSETGDPSAYLASVEKFAQNMRKAWEIGVEEWLVAGVVRRNRQSITTDNVIQKLVGITHSEVAHVKIGMSEESYFLHSTAELSERTPASPDALQQRLEDLKTWRKTVETRQKSIVL